jgi:hypothetical protein
MGSHIGLQKKYAAYALAGAALVGASNADASVVYVDNGAEGVISSDTNYDINGDTVIDYAVRFTVDLPVGVRIDSLDYSQVAYDQVTGYAVALNAGDVVNGVERQYAGSNSSHTLIKTGFSTNEGNWPNNLNDAKFVGLKFNVGADTHYGWFRVGAEMSGPSARVYDWAYESTPDTAITAGAGAPEVPEPSTFALLALGAAGITALKRRRS